MIGAVILAAGAGARLGGVAKALLPVALAEGARASIHTTFLGAIVRTMAEAGVDPGAIVIVVGAPHGDAVAREAARHALAGAIVWNDDPARGMASSVAIGFEALARDAAAKRGGVEPAGPGPGGAPRAAAGIVHAALLWPVDHARVAASTIEALADALGDHDAAVPTHSHRGGHPVLVARALWPRLAACADAPDGARSVLRAARVIRVPVDDAGVVRDVDTPADLAEGER